ncbi:MAG: SURF1 family protein [Gammaproteobacteria bacterium]|nr:SURF1 family protein [Gammaproteobacteria bacterium]
MDRGAQKRALVEIQETRREMPVLNLDGSVPQFEAVEHRMLSAKGVFLTAKSIYLENRKHQGNRGYHVITPLKMEGHDRYLLVNRGWVGSLAGIGDSPSTDLRVNGFAVVPEPPAIRLGEGLGTTSSQQWPYFTLEDYSVWSGQQVYPFLLLQSPKDSHGFVRSWVNKPVSDGMHLGYALQWFAFALIVGILWIRLSLIKRSSRGLSE